MTQCIFCKKWIEDIELIYPTGITTRAEKEYKYVCNNCYNITEVDHDKCPLCLKGDMLRFYIKYNLIIQASKGK